MASHRSWFRSVLHEIAAFAAVTVFTAASPVLANGAFPDEFSIHFPPDAPHRILIGANFGLLVSEDDGATWRYACEPWVVAESNAALASANVIFYQVAADGVLLADAANLTRSTDVACTWPTSTGSITGQVITDFFPDPNDATFVVAEIAVSTGSYIIASHDGGKTFDAPHLYDTPDLLTGIEIARSKAGVVYATSVPSNSGGTAKFLASTNSGAVGTWTATELRIPPGTQPRILAVDPLDEKKVYLRLLMGLSDAMAVTLDGGQTFKTVLNINGQFSSFLRAGDGAIYAGTMDSKLYVRPGSATDPTAFTSHHAPHLRCLGQRPGTIRIYACADMTLDGFSLGSSDDNGATFQPVMSFTQLLGPLTCTPREPRPMRMTATRARMRPTSSASCSGCGAPAGRRTSRPCARNTQLTRSGSSGSGSPASASSAGNTCRRRSGTRNGMRPKSSRTKAGGAMRAARLTGSSSSASRPFPAISCSIK